YVGAFTWAVSWIGRRRAPALALAAAPFLWVTGEWVRARLLGGFPWGTLGYSQYLRLPVIQIAELGGVHAVSFVVVAVNTALASAEHPDLVVWPETATPAALRGDSRLLNTLIALSRTVKAPLLVGSIDVKETTPPRLTNSVFLLTERGIVDRYDKIHLVPFGE